MSIYPYSVRVFTDSNGPVGSYNELIGTRVMIRDHLKFCYRGSTIFKNVSLTRDISKWGRRISEWDYVDFMEDLYSDMKNPVSSLSISELKWELEMIERSLGVFR